MKKALLILFIIFTTISQSQEMKQIPTINVSGEGKLKVIPDQALVSISIETKGSIAQEVKNENNSKMDAVLKYIKKLNIAKEDYQTQRVSLNQNYDYEKKKHHYLAIQSLQIIVKDLSKYDELVDGLVNVGVNRIDNVEFKSSKLEQLQSEARKLAIKNAKMKAEDFISVLSGQKVGKAISISDNSQPYFPPRPMYEMKAMAMSDGVPAQRETLAPGEIEIVVNVNVGFILE